MEANLAVMENIDFLSKKEAFEIKERFGTPCFVYSEKLLKKYALETLAFPNLHGLTVRYAMKASSNRNILKLFDSLGMQFDASSRYEVERAILAGVKPEKICLSSQELPNDFEEIVRKGSSINLCSLNQIERFGRVFPGAKVGVRFNPGLGSGGSKATNTGGTNSSFGIWHERIDEVKKLAEDYNLTVSRIHTHIGSGSDPEVWVQTVALSLDVVDKFPEVTELNLGGGYKVARVPGEKTTDLQQIGLAMAEAFKEFERKTGRKLHLEIEPGTFLVANSCILLSTVQDLVETGSEGYEFIKLDCGMTEICRPALYGSQHPMKLHTADETSRKKSSYIVVGHCCESGDLLTPVPDQPNELLPRELDAAKIGDLLAVGGAGAYCSSMSTKNYNSFPECAEVFIRENGAIQLIRRRQELKQIIENELSVI